jgi:hypothetical protein
VSAAVAAEEPDPGDRESKDVTHKRSSRERRLRHGRLLGAVLLWTQGPEEIQPERGDSHMSATSGIHGAEDPVQEDRVHSEAPAEGDPEFDETEIRPHSMDPAEGADEEA